MEKGLNLIHNLFRRVRHIAVLFLLSLMSFQVSATHLVGGYISYQYISENSSGVKYLITINSYRDCKPNSLGFPTDIDVCVYGKNDLRLVGTYNFPRLSAVKVQPVGRTDCPEATQVCLERAIFQREIVLPKSSFGYYVKWEICCRNTQVNLRNGSDGQPFIGQTYQTIIPPSNLKNSSPVFSDVPVPFICINDTVELNNYAVDPDGDKLVYKLATPWYGASLSNNYPGCSNFYSPPQAIKPADYATGYNGTIPFGANGISKINSTNGVTTFKASMVGNYAVAIDLEEYRNGVLLSSTRLDMQILVINCSPNNKPTIGTSQQAYTIVAGDKLCFDVVGNDKDINQNLTLEGIGDIFTGANGFKGNKATFAKAFGKTGVKSQFCWQTSCNQASDTAYSFTARVLDDGCPSKFTIKNYDIKVLPFTAKVSINGPAQSCQGSKGIVYFFTTTANTQLELQGVTYKIDVVNGTAVSNTNNQVLINWSSSATTGSVTITPTSKFGCPGTPATFNVVLVSAPPAPILLSVDTVCENTARAYSVAFNAGYTYQWWVSNGSILGTSNSNNINITWAAPGKATAKVIQYNANSCPSDTAVLNVWISKPGKNNIIGKKVVCPNSNGMIYKLDSFDKGSSFQWFVSGGVISGSSTGNSITVNWGNPGSGFVKAIEINKFGCKGDTMELDILKDYNLIADVIVGDTDICEFTSGVKYSVLNSPNTVYNWTVSGGTIVSGQGTNQISVDWGASTTGTVSMYETSLDAVNNIQCISNLITRNVNIRLYPTANTINGTNEVCQSNQTGKYSLNGMTGSKYLWTINGDSSNIVGQGSGTIDFSYAKAGTFNLKVIETSQYGCEGQPVTLSVIVHPKPNTSPIVGDSIICSPLATNYTYSVTGLPSSTFKWWVDGGIITNGGAGNSIDVSWTGQQVNTVKVFEVSDFGCPGDTVRLTVFYDNPYLYLNYITVNPPPASDNGMDLYWKLDNAPKYNSQMFIERRKAGSSETFVNVGTVNGSVVSFSEGNMNNDSNAWEYRIKGYDLCGKELLSQIHTNILLTGFKPGPYSVSMDFTPYLGWGSATIRYDLYRVLKNSGEYELIAGNITDFKAAFANGLEYYTQCYRVKATKIGSDTVTWSNDICFNFDPVLFIPDAFSPNSDEFNDLFAVKGGALKTFEIKIYNRWGEKLFEGDNINFTWDGKYKDVDQPQDVYMYYCIYTGFDGKRYSTKGTITLLR